MQHVDIDPVLGQLVAVAPVQIDDAHARVDVAGREAEPAAGVFIVEVGPAEKAAVLALGDAGDMAVEHFIAQAGAERDLVLFLVAGNGVAGADGVRPVPEHIVVPGLGEQCRIAAVIA